MLLQPIRSYTRRMDYRRLAEEEPRDPLQILPAYGVPVWEARAIFHLGLGVLTRVVIGSPVASTPSRWLRRLSVALISLDLVKAYKLLDSGAQGGYRARAIIDTLDVAFWSTVIPTDHAITPALGGSLQTELALRYGARSLTLSAAQACLSMVLRKASGRRTELYPWVLSVAAWGGGLGLRRYALLHLRQLQRDRRSALEAAAREGRPAGEWDAITTPVPFGGSDKDALDRLRPLTPHMMGSRFAIPTWVLTTVEGTKRSNRPAGSDTVRRLLLAYRAAHNEEVPDVPRKIVYRPEFLGGVGDRWLTSSQAGALIEALSSKPPTGPWKVSEIEWNGYAREARLNIALRVYKVDADEVELKSIRLADLSPSSLIIGGFWSLLEVTEIGNVTPWTAAIVPSLGYAGLAVYADRALRRRGPSSERRIAMLASSVGALQATLTAWFTRDDVTTPNGNARVALQTASLCPGLLWGYQLGQRPSDRLAIGALAAIGVTALLNIRTAARRGLGTKAAVRWLTNLITTAIAVEGGRRVAKFQQRAEAALRSEVQEERTRARREGREEKSRQLAEATREVLSFFIRHRSVLALPDMQTVHRELQAIIDFHDRGETGYDA